MTAADRLRQAAQKSRAIATNDVTPGPWTTTEEHGSDFTGEGWSVIAVTSADGTEVAATSYPGGSDDAIDALADAAHIALWSPPVALAVAAWLDDTATDKDAGTGCIHPRALDLADLILGDTP